MIWTLHDWLNKFYSFYMAAKVGIVSIHDFRIKACLTNQPNMSKGLPTQIQIR